MKSFKFVFLMTGLVFSLLAISEVVYATTYLNVSVTPFVLPGQNITIFGSIRNTTATDTISGINVTANVSANLGSRVTNGTNGTAIYNFNITAPSAVGEHTINISTNSSSLPNKIITIYVSNATTGKVEFLNSFPPFTNGTTFTVNITLFNGSSLVTSYLPRVEVFQADGQNLTWTISNLSISTNSSGSIAYNITIPADANVGEYAIVVDKGVVFSVFRVGGNFQAAVNTRTSAGDVRPNFAPNSTVEIVEKLRQSDGTPITGATVSAIVTMPNGTTVNVSLTAHPTQEGVYNGTFSAVNLTGDYRVDVDAVSGGTEVRSSSVFSAQTFTGRIEPVKQFFFEWGGQGAFKPDQTVALNVILVNLTDDSIINQNSCPATNYALLQNVSRVDGTATTIANSSVQFLTSTFLPGTNVCKANFTAPSTSGTYNIKVNATVGSTSRTIEGFFEVQNFFLDVFPVATLGGEESFFQVFSPGENLTLQLKAVNVSNDLELLPQNITNVLVTRVLPMEFTKGTSEVTTLNQSYFNGTNPSTPPNVTLQLPTSVIGPILIEVQGRINTTGDIVKGTTFVISNYLTGFMSPAGISAGGAEMGHGSFSMDARCSGTIRFQGQIQDTKTSSAAQGASIVGIIEAREEETGKDVSRFLSISNSTASDSSGNINASVTFSPSGGYSFSGFYFVIFNASYKGNYAGVPAFFVCRNLNIGFPTIRAVGTSETFSWQIAPTSGLSVSLSNVVNMSGSLINNTSVLVLDTIFNFNPSLGSMQILKNNTPMQVTFNITGTGASPTANNATILIYPQNYSLAGNTLTQWPNGFFDLRPKVISNLGTDTGFGGFMVVAFDAFPEQFTFPQVQAGSVYSTTINARANVGNATNNGLFIQNSSFNNNTAFTIKMGRPWEGTLQTVTAINATKLSDNWDNTTSSFGFERWQVNFTIPSNLKKGGSQLLITVNGTTNNATETPTFNTVDVFLFVTVSKYNVIVPLEERVGDPQGSPMDVMGVLVDTAANPGSELTTINYGWNMTWIKDTYKFNSTSGRVCLKDTFNSTRSGSSGMPSSNIRINATNNTRILVLDRAIAGVYDTVILNRSNETVILNTSSRSIGGQLYLWTIESCGYFKMINVSTAALQGQGGSFITNTWGGSNQANNNFTIPYVIISGNTPQNGATVAIKSIGKQDNRGFGFEAKLTASNYTATSATTNADGLAFVTLNVTPSGRFVAFWQTTVGSDTDTADFGTATFFETKAFATSARSFIPLALGLVTLTNDTLARNAWGAFTTNNRVFNATVTETMDSDFVQNGATDTWLIGFNETDNQTIIMNSPALSGSRKVFFNESIPATGTNTNLRLADWANGTNKIAYFVTDTSGFNSYFVNSGTQNITSLICAEGFQRPQGKPVEGATINVSVTDWSTFPSTTKYLDIYKVSNITFKASASDPAKTSPSGCLAVHIGPGQLGSWPSASAGRPPVFIEGTINDGTNSEFVYVGDVFRP